MQQGWPSGDARRHVLCSDCRNPCLQRPAGAAAAHFHSRVKTGACSSPVVDQLPVSQAVQQVRVALKLDKQRAGRRGWGHGMEAQMVRRRRPEDWSAECTMHRANNATAGNATPRCPPAGDDVCRQHLLEQRLEAGQRQDLCLHAPGAHRHCIAAFGIRACGGAQMRAVMRTAAAPWQFQRQAPPTSSTPHVQSDAHCSFMACLARRQQGCSYPPTDVTSRHSTPRTPQRPSTAPSNTNDPNRITRPTDGRDVQARNIVLQCPSTAPRCTLRK